MRGAVGSTGSAVTRELMKTVLRSDSMVGFMMRLVLGRFSTRDRQVLGRFLDRDWQVDDIRSGSMN